MSAEEISLFVVVAGYWAYPADTTATHDTYIWKALGSFWCFYDLITELRFVANQY